MSLDEETDTGTSGYLNSEFRNEDHFCKLLVKVFFFDIQFVLLGDTQFPNRRFEYSYFSVACEAKIQRYY